MCMCMCMCRRETIYKHFKMCLEKSDDVVLLANVVTVIGNVITLDFHDSPVTRNEKLLFFAALTRWDSLPVHASMLLSNLIQDIFQRYIEADPKHKALLQEHGLASWRDIPPELEQRSGFQPSHAMSTRTFRDVSDYEILSNAMRCALRSGLLSPLPSVRKYYRDMMFANHDVKEEPGDDTASNGRGHGHGRSPLFRLLKKLAAFDWNIIVYSFWPVRAYIL